MQIFPWDIFALIWAFSVTPKISADEDQGMFFRIEENAFLDDKNALQSEKADSILTCARMCRREAACKEANFLANKGTCSLFGEGQQARKVERFVKRDGSFYIEKVFLEFCRFYRLILCYHFFLYSVRLQRSGVRCNGNFLYTFYGSCSSFNWVFIILLIKPETIFPYVRNVIQPL